MADLRIFVECSTKAVFDARLEAGDITSEHLVFIKSTNQIYHNGVYYGLNADWNASSGISEILNKPTNLVCLSDDSGVGIVPEDGIRAESITASTAINVNPDVLTVINGAVGGSATTITFTVPNDSLAHTWDVMMTTAANANITFVMSNSATIKVSSGFVLSGNKSVEIGIVGVGSNYYLRYGEFT